MTKWHKTEEQKLKSPCVHFCNFLDDVKVCGGCFRTAEEIKAWRTLDENDRKVILEKTKQRQRRYQD